MVFNITANEKIQQISTEVRINLVDPDALMSLDMCIILRYDGECDESEQSHNDPEVSLNSVTC